MIRIRAFRAVDEPESCEKFVEGHMKILKVFDIAMITSANVEWFKDPLTYVIAAESTDTGKMLGGARVQIAGGSLPLPIEKAVKDIDDRIFETVKNYAKEGTGELCGLWNSREIAGMGIGSVHLTRTAVCIAPQLNLKSLFALCAPYTVEMAEKVGFEVTTFLGNNGTFYYPKEDLVATGMLLHDSHNLPTADQHERDEINSIRAQLQQVKVAEGRRGPFDLHLDLEIKNRP
jgi:hypothetical protein